MKAKKIAFLTVLCLMGLIFGGTMTTEAKHVKFTFDGYEFQLPDLEIPPDKVWMDENFVLHIHGGVYFFEISHFYFEDGILEAPTKVLNIDTTTGLGNGNGGNIITATSAIPGFEGLEIYMEGNSVLKFEYGFIHGWATSKGTIGDYKIMMKGEFGPEFDQYGNFVATYLKGTLKIFI